MQFIDVHCHAFGIEDLPMQTLLRRHGFGLKIGMFHLPVFKFDNRARRYVHVCQIPAKEKLERTAREARAVVLLPVPVGVGLVSFLTPEFSGLGIGILVLALPLPDSVAGKAHGFARTCRSVGIH